ncbi:type II toxin-antitoxin system RelE/ParE family toxin [Candidatus Saccharibacteria bacterium]|nr:type II toxin-antitoxin system RelE/ParE family toxin [Candidatus Saccharibacteria bacterium]
MKTYRIIISDNAWNDISDISNYISSVSSEANAQMVIRRIFDKLATFKTFPKRNIIYGHDEKGRTLRATMAGKYRIIYHVSDSEVWIARIVSRASNYINL